MSTTNIPSDSGPPTTGAHVTNKQLKVNTMQPSDPFDDYILASNRANVTEKQTKNSFILKNGVKDMIIGSNKQADMMNLFQFIKEEKPKISQMCQQSKPNSDTSHTFETSDDEVYSKISPVLPCDQPKSCIQSTNKQHKMNDLFKSTNMVINQNLNSRSGEQTNKQPAKTGATA